MRLVLSLLLAGCVSHPITSGQPSPSAPAIEPPTTEPLGRPVTIVREGSPVLLARAGSMLAIVSDADAGRLHFVDLDHAVERAFVEIDAPGPAILLADGTVAVTSRAENAILVVEWSNDGARVVRRWKTGLDPTALALTPDDRMLLVGTSRDHALEGYDIASGTRAFVAPLSSPSSAITVDPEGRHALVASKTSSDAALVDLASGTTKATTLDANGNDVEPAGGLVFVDGRWDFGYGMRTAHLRSARMQVRVHARHAGAWASVAEFAYIAHELLVPSARSSEMGPDPEPKGYGGTDLLESAEHFGVSIVEKRTGKRISFHRADSKCRLPRGQAFAPERKQLVVACAGTNNLVSLEWDSNVSWSNGRLVKTAPNFVEKSTIPLPGPGDGVALDAENERVVATTLFDSTLVIVREGKPTNVKLARRAPLDPVARGRALFYRAGDPTISSDGRACATCHIDGRSDNLAWKTKRGLRSTPVLVGRLDRSGPFGWNGESPHLHAHVDRTIRKNLGGKGLDSASLDALVAYLRSMPYRSAPPPARGEALFASTGCADCHRDGGRQTDGELHAIHGNRPPTLTPSLVGLALSAPYFHDGRYDSLDALLTKTDGAMGSTRALTDDDRSALLDYLRSL